MSVAFNGAVPVFRFVDSFGGAESLTAEFRCGSNELINKNYPLLAAACSLGFFRSCLHSLVHTLFGFMNSSASSSTRLQLESVWEQWLSVGSSLGASEGTTGACCRSSTLGGLFVVAIFLVKFLMDLTIMTLEFCGFGSGCWWTLNRHRMKTFNKLLWYDRLFVGVYAMGSTMFFPIIRQEHYFLLCFDFRRFRLEIIDNSSSPTSKKFKYGECLVDTVLAFPLVSFILFFKMVDITSVPFSHMLQEFFTKTHPGRLVLCVGLEPKRMQMPWRDVNNKIDCGVYLMRHMEVFTGQAVSHLDCGLVKGDYCILHRLRLQYMKGIVLLEYNLHRSRNLARACHSISAPLDSI
nr:zinc finger BED domain-containing protein RICESLEEPER 2-like [Ipomoea batatas]